VPIIGKRLVDGFIAQVLLCTTIATGGNNVAARNAIHPEHSQTREEDCQASVPAIGELFSLKAAVLTFRGDPWGYRALEEEDMLLLFYAL
jgi:hypothetical protein